MANPHEGQSEGVNISGGSVNVGGGIYQKDKPGPRDTELEARLKDSTPEPKQEKRGVKPEIDGTKKLRITFAEMEEIRDSLKLKSYQMKEFTNSDGKRWKYGTMNVSWGEFAIGEYPDYVANYDLVESEPSAKTATPERKVTVDGDLGGEGKGVNITDGDIKVSRDVVGGKKK